MESKRILKYSLSFFIILISINFLFSYSLNKAIQTHFENGVLENLTVEYKNDYTVNYYYDGIKMDSYERYSDAMNQDKYGVLLYSNNGLTYNRKTPLGNQSYIIDYSWLKKGVYNEKDILDYTKNHKWLMLFRTSYLSSGWIYILGITILLFYIMKLIVPTILFFLINIITYFKYKSIPDKEKSDEQFKNFELFRSLILTKSLNKFKESREYFIITLFYSYFMIYAILVNSSVYYIQTFLIPIILIYLGILTFISLYVVVKVLYENEFKKLENNNE